MVWAGKTLFGVGVQTPLRSGLTVAEPQLPGLFALLSVGGSGWELERYPEAHSAQRDRASSGSSVRSEAEKLWGAALWEAETDCRRRERRALVDHFATVTTWLAYLTGTFHFLTK